MIFAGRLEPDRLGLVERFAVRAIKASTGDYQDWAGIRRWARQIETSIALAEDSAGSAVRR